MVTKSIAIERFLKAKTHSDLSNLYNLYMECQVNVAQDGGKRIEGDYRGRKWHGWTDGLTTWKSFRIPFQAYSDPYYTDSEISFNLEEHVEAIGMTGWNWFDQVSKWVAFDFDALIGHSNKHTSKLTEEELENVKEAAEKIPWVTIRKSTSGKGLHLYVHLDSVGTANHHEHAALGRSILGIMSGITGFDFENRVDICGGNMWIWHRKMEGTDGLILLKEGSILKDIPRHWKDHIKVVTGRKRKNLPKNIEKAGIADTFEELAGQYPKVPLDDQHKILINYLQESGAIWWWDQDHHALVTHTWWLQKAHEELSLKGFFESISPGTNLEEQNCFAFPMRKGGWAIRRFSLGVQEHVSWDQDGFGWTRTYLNREPTLQQACRAFGGIEDPSGGFVFREAEIAMKATALLGIHFNIGNPILGRETKIKQHKDGRLIAEIEYKPTDHGEDMPGWLPKKGKIWTKVYNIQSISPTETDHQNYDDLVRHLVTSQDEDYGWMIKTDNRWRVEPISHIRVALGAIGLNNKDIVGVLGSSVFKCWTIVNKPFQSEYPGDRQWNRYAAKFRFNPSTDLENLSYTYWLKILNHCGSGLNEAVKVNSWCRANGILTGGDYLKCWIASLFQEPGEPLPYLFFYSQQQGTGKSIFHEALSLLLTKGYQRSDAALISQAGFNAELEGAIICVVEETDLRKNNMAYNRIKDWVTGRELLIHCKGKTPYHIPNTTHWIQCSNNHQSCPIFPGDTRITMGYVEPIDPLKLIPKKQFIPLLEKEANDFLAAILHLEIPPSNDRLNVPVIATADKMMLQKLNETPLERFIADELIPCPGAMIKQSEFYERFQDWLDPEDKRNWSKIRVGREIPTQFPRARQRGTGQFYIGNIAWKEDKIEPETKLIIIDGYLENANN
jgi:hypothetical protein